MPGPELTREQILAQALPAPVRVEVPEWGGFLYVKALPAEDLADLGEIGERGMMVEIVIRTACSADGTLLFTSENREQLAAGWFRPITRVFTEAAKVNGLSTEALEEAMGNFDGEAPERKSSGSLSLSGSQPASSLDGSPSPR